MKKVVIINDNKDFLMAMKELLNEEGKYNTVIVHEGELAFHQVKDEKPELIILDIRMESPVTGWKILDLLTLDPVTSNIPVIICSASADRISAEKLTWLADHSINVLPKPFDISDLLALLDKIFIPDKQKAFMKKAD